jgi:peptide/nickel transport system ATP-binding protein
MSVPVLDVRDLHVTYSSSRGPVPAVRGVSLRLDAGETLGLAGESGSGKSTMTMALLRLVPVGTTITGSIMLAGEDVLAMKPGRLRAVRWAEAAVVFQGAQHVLNPVQRIRHQIQEAIDTHRGTNKVSDLLEQVGIPRRRGDAYPHELSGGQKQRVMIAMALACDPQLLIADEPTTALDVMVQAQVLQLLADLQRDRGLAMIFITHDLSVLSTVADRLAVMYAGRLVETGPAKEMLRGAKHPYTKALAAAFPTIGDVSSRLAPSGLAGDPPDPAAVPGGCTFHPRCPMATEECSTTTVDLHEISTGWDAACLKL